MNLIYVIQNNNIYKPNIFRLDMEKETCKKCTKVIEGYTKNHVEHLMQQHMLKHEREENNAKLKNPSANGKEKKNGNKQCRVEKDN